MTEEKHVDNFAQPGIFNVRYELMHHFRSKVEAEGCAVVNVIEIITCKVIQYWIDFPKEKDKLISDYAFMTWIKNPVFQKYYHGTKEFEQIAASYINDREESEILKHVKDMLSMDSPWPLTDVLDRLCNATDYLLTVKGYDGDHHEEYLACLNKAKELKTHIEKAGIAIYSKEKDKEKGTKK